MKTAIAKWGNSLAVRLPRHLAEGANLTAGSPVEIWVENQFWRTRLRWSHDGLFLVLVSVCVCVCVCFFLLLCCDVTAV